MNFGQLLGQMFGGIAGADNGVHLRVWAELKPWLANLGPAATRKWLPRVAADMPCEIDGVDCPNVALAACDVCHNPVCLSHSRIDQYGDAICYRCVNEAMKLVPPARRARVAGEPPRQRPRQDPPPPPKPGIDPAIVAAAWATLGLQPGASWQAVTAAHRKLSARNHPDKFRQKPARERAKAERIYLDVQKALDVLKRVQAQS